MIHKLLLIAIIALPLVSCEVTGTNETQPPQWGILDWFPFGWQENGIVKGMFVNLMPLINQTLNSNSEAILTPVSRAIRGTEEGNFDFTITYRDQAMMKKVEYLVDIGCLKTAIISLKSASIHSLHDLNGKRVAYPGIGYFSANILPTLSIKGVEVPRSDMMVNMAFRGRLDAFVINDAVWAAYTGGLNTSLNVPKERWLDFAEPLFMKTLPIAISVSHMSEHRALAEQIKTLMENDRFVEQLKLIYAKYNYHYSPSCLNKNDP